MKKNLSSRFNLKRKCWFYSQTKGKHCHAVCFDLEGQFHHGSRGLSVKHKYCPATSLIAREAIVSTFHSKSLKGFERLAQELEHFTCDWLFLIQTRHNQSQWSESDRIAASASSKTHHNTVFNDLITSLNHIACRHWTNRCNFTKLVNFTRNISVDHARRTSVRFKSPPNNACPSQRFFTPLSMSSLGVISSSCATF